MSDVKTEFVFTATFDVPQIRDLGPGPLGNRRIATVTGGKFEGPGIRGTALTSPGGDWLMYLDDGATYLDVRVTLETDDGELIYMTYAGRRSGPPEVMAAMAAGQEVDPDSYYFRIAPVFETASKKHDWMNSAVFIGRGHRMPTGPIYHVHRVL